MLLRLAEAQERKLANEVDSAPDSWCPAAVERYRTTAIVLRESPRRSGCLQSPAAADYIRYVALGDSATYNLGDRVGDEWRGWARILAASIGDAHHVSFCNLARPGVTVHDVRREQLGPGTHPRRPCSTAPRRWHTPAPCSSPS